jgi:hypothetical protein
MNKFSAGDIVRAANPMWENPTEEEKQEQWEIVEPHDLFTEQGIPAYRAKRLEDNKMGILHEDELVVVDD